MRKHMLVLTTTVALLACGAIPASAQAPGAPAPSQQSPTTQPIPNGPMMQQKLQEVTGTTAAMEVMAWSGCVSFSV